MSETIGQDLRSKNVRVVRVGHGANCSSIGSVVDALFASAVIGGAVLAAVLAVMKKESVTVVGPSADHPTDRHAEGTSTDEDAP